MTERLFAYGTLRAPELMQDIAGRRLPRCAARLLDHAAYPVRGAAYPGLVPEAGRLVRGVLWEGLDAAALRRLDRYEGALYVRRRVRALTDGGARLAWAYVFRTRYRDRLGDDVWERDRLDGDGARGRPHRLKP